MLLRVHRDDPERAVIPVRDVLTSHVPFIMMFKYTSKCQEIVKEGSPLTAEGAAALARCVGDGAEFKPSLSDRSASCVGRKGRRRWRILLLQECVSKLV